MTFDIQLVRERKGLTKIITGSVAVRPDFKEFKDLPAIESIQLGGKPAYEPRINLEIKVEKGVFTTSYLVIANFHGTMPLSNKRGGALSGFAEVTQNVVRYFTPEGEPAGINTRKRLPLDKAPGLSSAMGDEYSLGIEGNLTAVMRYISSAPIFSLAGLHLLKAVAIDAGDIAQTKSS